MKVGTCDACIKIHNKRNLVVPCDDCPQGFVEPVEGNYICIGLLDKYGIAAFTNTSDSTMNLDTNGIRNVLEAEGYTGSEYRNLFNGLVIYVSQIISSLYKRKSNGSRKD